ncbi:hemoblobin-interacting domain-containing protein [Petroclostridium sp. X23]|jgi:hypothetical protein|uniref:hemoblobin-interacting domain-containing protein n=1 Tax=Petroclostridium sp. X23 TaxID=3045146 RepID=UPI0024ACC9D5|nr:hemoblobin-interacting domain-containing protein [Petroclostridium sp. X23]WHH57903.1 DUF1533 domain-containing protein [Petroclostridium sp. X23]
MDSIGTEESVSVSFITEGELTPPVIAADTTQNTVGQPIEIVFSDNTQWREAITKISVDDMVLADTQYTIEVGKIIIDSRCIYYF